MLKTYSAGCLMELDQNKRKIVDKSLSHNAMPFKSLQILQKWIPHRAVFAVTDGTGVHKAKTFYFLLI